MKFLIILASVAAVGIAQRPTYAGQSSKGYPELASRFRDPADDENNVAVGNRLGIDDDQTPQNLPTDARGDALLVNRLNQWPRENRPFWLINAQHLETHRHPNENKVQQQQNINISQQGIQQRLNEIQPSLNGNERGLNQGEQTLGINQQPVGLPINNNAQGLNQGEQTLGINQQPVGLPINNNAQNTQVQPRFGEPVATETRTIKPLRQRGFFAGGTN